MVLMVSNDKNPPSWKFRKKNCIGTIEILLKAHNYG